MEKIMNNQVTISKENILNAYNQASEEQKVLLENMFGKDIFQPRDIKERVKTFDDAVVILGNDNQAVIDYYAIADETCTEDILAFAKLRVIAEALNEGWKPKFDSDECRYYPWFYIYTKEEYEKLDEDEKKACRVVGRSVNSSYAGGGVVCALAFGASSYSYTYYGSRLAFKTIELAEYCGKQFIDIWAEYLFSYKKRAIN